MNIKEARLKHTAGN